MTAGRDDIGRSGSVAKPGTAQAVGVQVLAPDMVGRDHELAALGETLSRPPALVLVSGEAGIGKSRLIHEFLSATATRRHETLVGVCPPVQEPFLLGPIVDAVRQVRGAPARLRLSALAGALRPLFPEWTSELPPSPEPIGDASAARHRLFRALAELLDGIGAKVLVLEDVHWAGEPTLEFLLFIVSRRPRTTSLVLTYRPEEVPAGSPLTRLSARASSEPGYLRLELPPLDVNGTAQLVSSMLDHEQVSEAFATFLHERTGGVPLAVEESVRLLHDRADVTRVGGEWIRRSLTELQVPPTVRDSVLERVQRLGPAAQQVLCATAVLAEPVDEQVVIQVADLPEGEARSGLAKAVTSGLLRDDRMEGLAFRHALSARAVYEMIAGPDRRAFHLRSGDVLEGLSPPPLGQLAVHFRQAGDVTRWSKYAELAADQAAASGDDRTALTLLTDLLLEADLAGANLARVAKKLASALKARRMPFEPLVPRAVGVLRTVLADPEVIAQDKATIRSCVGRVLIQIGEYEEGYAELERAVPALAHDPVEAVRTMYYLAWPFASPFPASVHLEWLERARRVVVDAGSAVDRLGLKIDRVSALLQLGEETGWAIARDLPERATGTAQRRHAARGQLNVGWAAMRWGRYAEARQRLTTCLSIADVNDDATIRWFALVAQAHLDWFTGRWDGLAGRVAALVESEEASPANQIEAMVIAGMLDAATGSRRDAEDRLRRAHADARQRGGLDRLVEPAAALARLYLAEGRSSDALQVTDEAMATVAGKEIWIWAPDIARARVEALVLQEQVADAAEQLDAYADWLRDRDVPAGAAAVVHCQAVIAAGGRDYGQAADLFACAAEHWEQLPRPYDALLARSGIARCLLVAGHREQGVGLLSQVFNGLSELGATRTAGQLVPLLREHGHEVRRPQRGGRRSYGDRLSPRELEVVDLLAAGQTNRQIAAVLVVSPKTVARHVESAMRKLSVSSRTALAVEAVAAGLVADPAQRDLVRD